MPRAKENKLYRTFTKGMITEAGYLTYPEDASTDELNVIISRKGNRTRRRGIEFQDDYEFSNVSGSDNVIVNEHTWISVNNDPMVSFLCVQVGTVIHFYDMASAGPLSASKLPFSIDLAQYKINTTTLLDLSRTPVEFSSGFGLLFVAHSGIDPLSVEYKPLTQTLEVIRIVIQIRDLEGVYDGLSNDEEPTQLSKEHQYNLQNQSWLPPGTRTVIPSLGDNTNPSEGSTGGSPGSGGGGGGYIDPYTGEDRASWGGGGGSIVFGDNFNVQEP